MSMTYKLHLTPRHYTADQARAWLQALCLRHGVDPTSCFQTTLCLVEAVNNLLLHTPGDNPAHPLAISATFSPAHLEVTLRHRAPPFRRPPGGQPTDASIEPISNSAESLLRESGRGWLILDHWLETVAYRHDQGINTLILRRRLTPPPDSASVPAPLP